MDTTNCDGLILDGLHKDPNFSCIPPTPATIMQSSPHGSSTKTNDYANHDHEEGEDEMELVEPTDTLPQGPWLSMTPLTASVTKKDENPFERTTFAENCRRRLSFAKARLSSASDMDVTRCAGDIFCKWSTWFLVFLFYCFATTYTFLINFFCPVSIFYSLLISSQYLR